MPFVAGSLSLPIEVGTPVARRAPRRSRRAELPHRAPRWTRSECDAGPRLFVGLHHAGRGVGRNTGVNGSSTTRGGAAGPTRPGGGRTASRPSITTHCGGSTPCKSDGRHPRPFNPKSTILNQQSSIRPPPCISLEAGLIASKRGKLPVEIPN